MILIAPASRAPVVNLADRRTVEAILNSEPELSWRGWWRPWNNANEPPGTLDRVRRETLDEYGLAQFRRALDFLEVAPRTDAINRTRCCYSWKHECERWHRSGDQPYRDTYTGEGAFIAACIANGMPIKRTPRGTFTTISNRAWLGHHA
jgi:hypothetical protein